MKYWRKPLDIDEQRVPRGEVRIIVDRCKGCGFCVEYCPKDVLEVSEEFNAKGYHPPKVVKHGECVNCNLCEMICPDFAIYSVPVAEETTPATREEAAPATTEAPAPPMQASTPPEVASAAKEVPN